MAERTVTLRLKAIDDQYKRAMRESAQATQGLVTKAGGLDKLGGKMQQVGGTLTRSVTLPLALAGGAAVKLSLDFESTFSRMVGLAGVAADEVEGLKESVLKLAGETTRPPQELAEALYFIRSAGLDGQDALDALEMSAKAAAAGLGDTVTVADAVTSAMNAYGSDVLSAAEATDVLASTAEQGKVEASALAGQFGRLLPVSAELGVTFDQIGGALGFLTRTSGSAELAATQLGGVLSKVLAPGQKGIETLEEIGFSMDDLRASVQEKGLLQSLEDLRNRLEANGMEFSDFAEDQQFIQGALMLTGQNFKAAGETIDAVGDSTGKTEEAFAAFADTAGFKNAQAFAKLQSALISLGDTLVPLVANFAEFAAVFLDAFAALPGPAQTAVVALAGVLAATGPLLSIGGKLVSNWQAIGRGFDKAAIGAFNLSGNLRKIATTGAALAVIGISIERTINAWSNEMAEANEDATALARTLAGDFDPSKASMNQMHDEIIRLNGAIAELDAHHDEAINPFLRARYAETSDQLMATRDALLETEAAAAQLQIELGISSDEALRMATNTEIMGEAIDPVTGEIDAQAAAAADDAAALEELEAAIKDVTNALRAQFDPLFAAQDALLGHRDAQEAVTAAELELIGAADERNKAIKEHGRKSDEAAEAAAKFTAAERKLDEANRKVTRTALDVSVATAELKTRMDETGFSAAAAKEQLGIWVAQGLLTEEQARDTAEELGFVGAMADALGGRNIAIPVSADTSSFERQISDLYRRTRPDIRISVGGGGGLTLASGGPVPGAKGAPVPATLHGGEHVLSADVVDAIKHGKPTSGLAGMGGAPAGGTSLTVVVNGVADTPASLVKLVTKGVNDANRRTAGAFF